ncbi:MAG: hydrogen peroxide-inducible genes activator [Pseudomonadales bacterium]|nr:hydrogen peroxide-inducible genes activator [Pseudomonadales bacterium]MCP5213563.1 hydrogen peroxide-inducible genes activator [Pseudomonadales bacterium]
MTLTELRYLVSLARLKHFGRAAEYCHVTQPTLSIAVKKLEEELGVPLFERLKNTVHLTPQGQQIVKQAERVLGEADILQALAQANQDPLKGSLKLGAIFTIGPYLFPHIIPQLQKLAPEMPLYIEENYTAKLREKLRLGELDVIIISLPFTEQDVLTQTLYDEPFVLLLPPSHALSAEATVACEALNAEQLLLLGEGHCFRDQVLQACPNIQHKYGESKDAASITEGSSLETLRHMVASGMGITVLPQMAAGDNSYAAGLLTTRPFTAPSPKRTVALAWRTSFTRPQVIDVLNQAIRACQLF